MIKLQLLAVLAAACSVGLAGYFAPPDTHELRVYDSQEKLVHSASLAGCDEGRDMETVEQLFPKWKVLMSWHRCGGVSEVFLGPKAGNCFVNGVGCDE